MNKKNLYAEVILSLESLELDHPFDYLIPEKLVKEVSTGSIVLVPFRSRQETGYVVRVKTATRIAPRQIKEIKQIVIGTPIFNQDRLKLIYWMSFYYMQPLGSVARLFLPPGGKIKTERAWVPVKEDAAGHLDLTFPLRVSKAEKNPGLKLKLDSLEKKGHIRCVYVLTKPGAKLRYEDIIHINHKRLEELKSGINWKKNAAQKRIIEYLQKQGPCPRRKVLKESKSSYGSLRPLVDKSILVIKKERLKRSFRYESLEEEEEFTPNPYQEKCLKKIIDKIDREKFGAFLIEGIAGSGKTKVYIDACREVLKKGKRALVLTPEISLTPQLFGRFEKEFKGEVSIYHSNMGIAERYENWIEIGQGSYKVVIGTRSAVFTPIKDLGIIILDEEHDPSYKENSKVRYNTQDVALRLGKILNIPVVFGSATPSVCSRYKSEHDSDFELLKIPVKASPSPDAQKEAIDLRKLDSFKQSSVISNRLHAAIKEEIDRKNKVIIFLNKRGYSNFVICNSCGNVPKCPACNLSFKYHIGPNLLRCHHCGREMAFSKKCIKCGKDNIVLKGTGIQRVERQLNLRFEDVPVIRMDSDVTTSRKSHQKILNQFISCSPAILLGTQMIAKGLDIGDVTLVGIINADSMLELPDYHMYERAYQLICQVAGRAGRKDKKGRVLIQTYNPQHEVIRCFLKESYESFYAMELDNRKELSYPPYSNIINIIVSGTREEKVKQDCQKFFTEAGKIIKIDDSLLGPAPSPFYRINRYYRWHVIIKTGHINRTIARLNKLIKSFRKDEGNKLIVDVDPAWIL
ncbi:MAG: replication restart helicase PriA [Actinomycetota bacterium]